MARVGKLIVQQYHILSIPRKYQEGKHSGLLSSALHFLSISAQGLLSIGHEEKIKGAIASIMI